jgi:hypothetical protein
VTLTGHAGAAPPAGTVVVEDVVSSTPTVVCRITSLEVSGGVATGSCTTAAGAFPAGTVFSRRVTAHYAGGSGYTAAYAAVAQTLSVVKGGSTTKLVLSKTTVVVGKENAERFSVTVAPQYAGLPGGAVRVMAGSVLLCTVMLAAGKGSCSPAVSALPAGTYSVTASYGGSTDFSASRSGAARLVVTS